MFAKLFGTSADQVLVKLEATVECLPEVRVFFEHDDVVLSIGEQFSDTGDGWLKARQAFADMDEAKTRAMADEARRDMDAILGRIAALPHEAAAHLMLAA